MQKKGLSDLTGRHVVVVVGGCEGSAVLAVVELAGKVVRHKLQLRGDTGEQQLEGGCEGGACQYSVVGIQTATFVCS